MKKLLSALAAVVTLLAANSCLREPDYIQDPSQAVTVSYSVTLDQVQKTKATLADLDNTIAVNKLFYSVYVQSGTGTTATFAPVNHSDYHKVVDLDDNGTAEVKIKLIENDTYKVVFWAQKDNAYLAVPTNGNLTAGALENISIDYTDSGSYADDKDAFTAYDILEISPVSTDDANGKSFQKEIHLKRPFAQINFGADDGTQAAALGYTPSKVKVSVKQAATTFNAATGVASGAQDVELKQVDLPETAVNFTVNNTDYQRIGKAYVLPAGTFTVDQDSRAITDALTANVEISLDLQLEKADQTPVDLDARSKANVPVRSNYRTNLLGSLITTDVTFNVVVDNDYDGSTDYISIVTAGNASGNGAVTLSQPETIGSNINFGAHPVTLDETLTIGADVTITGGSSITVNKGIVVAAGNTLTLDDVTINPSSSEATITIEPGATLIINGGTYTADSTQKLFDLLSGTSPNPAPGLRPRAHGADGDQLIIRGGSFTGFDPTPYVDTDHYTVTGTGPWTVAAKQVTLTVEAGDVNMKVGDEAVLKTLTVDPADTDLTGISFEYSVANVATASYSEGKISIAAVGAGSTVITVKVGTATATINVTVLPADSIEVAPASLSLKVGQTSEAVTVTLNNDATVSSVVSNNTNATVNWTSGNTFTVTGAAIGESTITVTASNGKTATVAVTVSKADAVKLAAPVLSTENAVADATSIMLSWAAVEHASGYAVSYGAESPVNVNTNEVTLSNLALATEYTISVVAKGDGDAYTDSDASNSIKVTTEKGTVTIVVAENKDVISIVKGLTSTISGVSVKYGETVLDVPVQYTLGSDADGKISLSGTTINALDVTDGAGINIVFAGNATYNAKTETDAIMVEVTAPVLESITLGTDLVTKTFVKGAEFSSTGLVVTANYNNGTTEDVSAKATVTAPDMTTAGEKTVTVVYGDKEATYTITVTEPQAPSKTDQEITLKLGNEVIGATLNKKYGDAAFTVTAEAPSNNVELSSKNTAVATVSGTTITIQKVGEAVIEATAAETDAYNAAPAKSFTLVVGKADGTLTLSKSAVTVTAGETAEAITVSNTTNTGATITAQSSDTEKATVAVTNGNIVVNGVSAGTATITVTAAATDNYTAATAEIAVTVEESGLPAIKNVTVAEFNAATPSETQRYRLTGIIGGSINTKYGNFDLTDETGTVYVYGLYPEEVVYGTTNPGENYFESIGVEAGDQITIVGYRYTYEQSDKIEVMYSFHEAHVKALAAPANLVAGKTDDKKITASWDDVTGADSYTVKIGDDEFANATSPFTSASAYADGTYSVSVKAVSSSAPDSPYCSSKSITIGDAPTGTTVMMDSFSGISGTVGNDDNVTYEAKKGNASTAPAINTSIIRIYQNGGTFQVNGRNGAKIISVTLRSDMATSLTHQVDTGTATESKALAKDADYTVNGISADQVLFTCTGTTSSTRLYVKYLSVTYTGGGAAKTTQTISFAESAYSFNLGDTFTSPTVTGNQTTVTYTSSNTNVATVNESTGALTLVAAGKATITATAIEDDTYKSATASYALTVVNPNSTNYTYVADDIETSGKGIVQFQVNSVLAYKLGSSSEAGILSITPHSGLSKITFYAVAWKGSSDSFSINNGTVNGDETTVSPQASDEATGNLTAATNLVINENAATACTITITDTTKPVVITSNKRVVIWGITGIK